MTEQPAVKSWKAMRDAGIVKQDYDFSCGAASIATLLNRQYGLTYSEKEILELLSKEAQETWKASFADMQKIMPSLGFRAEGYAVSFEQLQQLRAPVIVYLRYRNNDHFSVLYGIDGETVLLADPSLGHVSLSRAQFLDAWKTRDSHLSGKILAIVPDKAHPHPAKTDFFTRAPQRSTRHSMVFEQMPSRY
nr:C39 family peptidase [uncultured Cardiobacterium sp.]